MNMTRHAQHRHRQRGFQRGMVDVLVCFGEPRMKPGGLVEYSISARRIKQIIQTLDKVKKKAVLVDESTRNVVTCYNIISKSK